MVLVRIVIMKSGTKEEKKYSEMPFPRTIDCCAYGISANSK